MQTQVMEFISACVSMIPSVNEANLYSTFSYISHFLHFYRVFTFIEILRNVFMTIEHLFYGNLHLPTIVI
uniref:Uncharacterized protein n=1 Tax=Anguilla anguilla TaxID=7936 RepID=A0A0E9S158_ANGAN